MNNISQNSISNRERLELFVMRVCEIRDTQLIKSGFKPSFNFQSDFVKNTNEILAFHPNEENFRSFLTIYRKFISKKSPIFVNNILNICQVTFTHEQLKDNLIQVRNIWNKEFKRGMLNLEINQNQYCPEEILDLWINAVYFHDDFEKIKELENIMTHPIFYTVVCQIFYFLIANTTRQILYTGSVIEIGLKDNHFKFEN